MPVDGFDDLLAGGEHGLNVLVEDKLQLLERIHVVGVADDDLEGPVLLGHGQDDVFAGDRLGDEFDHGVGDGDFGEVDELKAVELGDGAHDLVGVTVAEFDERILQFGTGLLLEAPGFLELVGAEGLAADENVGEVAAALFGHGGRLRSRMDGRCAIVERPTRRARCVRPGERARTT
jgi:hypothetical protein